MGETISREARAEYMQNATVERERGKHREALKPTQGDPVSLVLSHSLTRPLRMLIHLRHVDSAHGQRFEAQNGPVFVLLPPLKHHVQLVALTF